jgi:hypothetical protein
MSSNLDKRIELVLASVPDIDGPEQRTDPRHPSSPAEPCRADPAAPVVGSAPHLSPFRPPVRQAARQPWPARETAEDWSA